MKTIGERIKFIRNNMKINQEKMASDLGVSGSHISGVERSNYKPSRNFLLSICKTYGVDMDWLETGLIPPTGISLNNAHIINGNGNIISDNSVVSSNKKNKLGIKEKSDMMDRFTALLGQGLMTEAQYKKAMDELWGVCNGEHDRKGSNID